MREPGVSKEPRREGELSRGASATFLGTSMLGRGEWEESSREEFNLGCRMDGLSSLPQRTIVLNTRPESVRDTSTL